jgi:secreted trypsin-like serine protease
MAPSCYATGHGGFENALEEGARELAETVGQKIYNGDNAPKDKPWMVSFPGWCGGSLIAPDVVLTAAHCVDKRIYRVDWVIIGAWDLRRWDREDHGWEPERRTIQSFKVHPKYKDEEKKDIALVYLDKPSSLPPVNLGTSRPKVGANVKIMGWQGDDKILEEADIKVHKPSQCKEEKIDEDNEICAGRLDARQHTCAGDSGGPLFANKNGEYEQLGLLNRGPWCPGTHDVYRRPGGDRVHWS